MTGTARGWAYMDLALPHISLPRWRAQRKEILPSRAAGSCGRRPSRVRWAPPGPEMPMPCRRFHWMSPLCSRRTVHSCHGHWQRPARAQRWSVRVSIAGYSRLSLCIAVGKAHAALSRQSDPSGRRGFLPCCPAGRHQNFADRIRIARCQPRAGIAAGRVLRWSCGVVTVMGNYYGALYGWRGSACLRR